MSKLVLSDITAGYNSTARINAAFAALEAALDNTLSRDGSTPNAMGASLDMNSNRVINLGSPVNASDAARWADVTSALALDTAVPAQAGNSGKYLGTNGSSLSWTNPPAYWPQTDVESTEGVTPSNYNYPPYHAWRYLNSTQLADVKAYGYTQNVTTPLQTCFDLAWEAQQPAIVPGGGYLVTTLTVPGTSARRERAFILEGAGVGEIFDRTQTGGTIFKSTADAPILQYVQDVASTGNGEMKISGVRFEGSSNSAYVVNLEALYGQSNLADLAIYQAGNGGGLQIGLSNTSRVENVYVINDDWNTTTLGAARTGIGVNVLQDINTGLTMLRKITSRGFLTGFNIGNGTTSAYVTKMEHCECSVVFNGIVIAANTSGAVIDSCYIEGGDGGTGITDNGNYTKIQNNLIFSGFATAVDCSNSGTYGTLISGNILAAGSVANTKLLKVGSSGAFGGPAKIVRDNSFTFSGSGGSIAGVVGILISGLDPRLQITGNSFDPRGGWVGGAGTVKISDTSTSSSHSGPGSYGITIAVDGSYEYPLLSRGAVSYGRNGTAYANAAVSAGTLTVNPATYCVLTFSSGQTISSIASTTVPDGHLFIFRITNGNCTFQNGANIKLSGSANVTPGANGGVIAFIMDNNVAYEVHRTLY